MKKLGILLLLFAATLNVLAQKEAKNIYAFEVKDIQGKKADLKSYKGKVVLVVNVASKCGLTKQYDGLEVLYKKYKDQGLVILGFPCNQFMGQEPGTEEEIATFCKLNYDVTFPMFSKIEVNGDDTHPLYQFLKKQLPGEGKKSDIEWNFAKFLIDRNGVPLKRYLPKIKPADLEEDIAAMLAAK